VKIIKLVLPPELAVTKVGGFGTIVEDIIINIENITIIFSILIFIFFFNYF
jgi:hypothetical protein